MVGAVRRDHPAVIHHHDIVKYSLDVVDQVGGQHHRGIFAVIAQDDIQNGIPRRRVDTAERLVDKLGYSPLTPYYILP